MLIEDVLSKLIKSKKILFKETNLIKKPLTYESFFKYFLKNMEILKHEQGSLKNEIIFLKLTRDIEFYISLISILLQGSKVFIIDHNIDDKYFYNLKKKFKPKLIIDQKLKKKKIKIFKKKIDFSNIKYSKIILFTSGTTGKPKAIQLNTVRFFESAIQFAKLIPIKKKDVILNNWPHYYTASVFNMFLCGFLNESTITLENQISSSNYYSYWEIINKNKISVAYLTPTMCIALINYIRFQNKIKIKSKNLKVISTGSYLYPYLKEKFYKKFKIDLLDCYGATEIGASISIYNYRNKKFKISKGVNFVIKNKKLGFLSKYIFEGYLISKNKLEENTNDIYYTGDIAKKVGKFFKIIGRENEIIKKGGQQVSLIKIENEVMKHKNVIDVICIPKKSKFWVEDFDCLIIFKKYSIDSISKLVVFLSKKLTSTEMPDKIIKVENIKKTSIGKKIRKKLAF